MWLWIAFIFQYLWDTKQHTDGIDYHQPSCELLSFFSIFGIQNNYFNFTSSSVLCCELLSFFSIFGIQNNMLLKSNVNRFVVNCFHFSVSLGYKTTATKKPIQDIMLWIAFIFQYLWDTKQHFINSEPSTNGCELLSFFSIFGIQNNFHSED